MNEQMNEQEVIAQLSVTDQRRIRRFIEKAQRAGQPFTVSHGGKIGHDSAGRMYARQKGGVIRIAITENNEPVRLVKWNKARKKAEKRARIAGRNRK